VELKEQLAELQGQLKTHFDKAAEQELKHGTVLEETKTKIDTLQKQVDAIDVKLAGRLTAAEEAEDGLEEQMKNDASIQRLLKDKRGNAVVNFTGKSARQLFERKTTITDIAVGTAVSGVLQIGRLPGITMEPRQQLTIRDLMTATPTTFQVIDFVKVASPMAIASPVPETSTKPENAVTFTTVSERVKTIATWIPASRQVLDDFSELMTFIRTMMPYYVNLEEELQILSGDNVGEDLHGLIPQASAFLTSQLIAIKGWNKIDIIGRAIQQITAAKELPPTFIVMHPNDWWDIRLTKDGFGRYILGDPQQGALARQTMGGLDPTQNLFGLTVDPTTNIAQGTFLVGTGNPIAAEIRDRMEMQIDVSTEHSTFFTQNLVAIRAEKRMALITRRPGSFVTGTFNTSP
jgi:HK97 family phage major capsid protein